ncbi:PASTA domain-containing protein [Streptomyces parvulus]|uniref:PASTA domain-containing protein n=1 Tax=Streptomyces parvulus TaxID=146923 RepID=A0A369V074_9ACTN|nr:PASTA domain-containing protein [Streptomyces parvulus]RDD86374.1 PASTA domain-containing protein [Streptomyces parvulus]
MRLVPEEPEVHVPRLVGLMAVDARETARARGLSLYASDRPDVRLAVVDHVVRQFPQPGARVPRDSTVYVWFDFGEGEGGGGIREPRVPWPPPGGLRRELTEPAEPGAEPLGTAPGGSPRCAVLSSF